MLDIPGKSRYIKRVESERETEMKDLRKATNEAFDVAEENPEKWFVSVDSDGYSVVVYEIGADHQIVWHPVHSDEGEECEAGWWVCDSEGRKCCDRRESIAEAIEFYLG